MQKIIAPSERRIANVVMMGMGEPMLNYDNVMKEVNPVLSSKLRIINEMKERLLDIK